MDCAAYDGNTSEIARGNPRHTPTRTSPGTDSFGRFSLTLTENAPSFLAERESISGSRRREGRGGRRQQNCILEKECWKRVPRASETDDDPPEGRIESLIESVASYEEGYARNVSKNAKAKKGKRKDERRDQRYYLPSSHYHHHKNFNKTTTTATTTTATIQNTSTSRSFMMIAIMKRLTDDLSTGASCRAPRVAF